MDNDIQQWGNSEHRICYEALRQINGTSMPFLDIENSMIAAIGADNSFELLMREMKDLGLVPPDEIVIDVMRKALRHAEYRQLTKLK